MVKHQGVLRRVCKFVFTKKDASVYLIPYAPTGTYYFGQHAIPEQEQSVSFDCSRQFSDEVAPKLSIHESGQVHAQTSAGRAGPLTIPALADLRGEHVATVTVDNFEGLLPHKGPIRKAGAETDFPLEFPDSTSGRFVVCINGVAPEFSNRCPFRFNLSRPSIGGTLYVGIAPKHQDSLRDGAKGGVTVVSGWDPYTCSEKPLDYLYLRGV